MDEDNQVIDDNDNTLDNIHIIDANATTISQPE